METDKNVFDIQQGVAICLLVKHPYFAALADNLNDEPGDARVAHADLYGLRQHKYTMLQNSAFYKIAHLTDVAWKELKPSAPFYLFKPQEQEVREEYERGWSITDIFGIRQRFLPKTSSITPTPCSMRPRTGRATPSF